MKKSFIFTGVILAAIILIQLISTITNKTNPPYVYAYDPTYSQTGICVTNYSYYTSPNLVNDFDTSHASSGCTMQAPPIGSENDYASWSALQSLPTPTPYPTPIIGACNGQGCSDGSSGETCSGTLVCVPNPAHSEGWMRLEWTGNNYFNPQYISLPQSLFENDNCDGSTYPNPCPTPSGNWSKYGYLTFFEYLNYNADHYTPGYVSQVVQLYDGNVTITSGAITIAPQGIYVETSQEPWIYHVTVSLNFLANQWFGGATGRYFSVSNIANVIIPAPQTFYSDTSMPSPTIPGGFTQYPNSRSLIMYYDYLTLGANTDLPCYDSPAGLSVTTAFGSQGSYGAYIGWTPLASGALSYAAANSGYSSVTWVPVTGYHIYRSAAHTAGNGTAEYDLVGTAVGSVVPGDINQFVDTTCPGGNTFCYRVLSLNNGPTIDWNVERTNTIDASYNEPLLNATNVIEICGYVLPPATPTPTATSFFTPTITPTNCPLCATATITPVPTSTNNQLSNAYVYPNPYNPNGSLNGGDKVFHVGNVQDGTMIHIYSMDGSLVYDGTYSASAGGFTWNGRNKNSSLVVSGLYYLVLKDPNSKNTAVFRVIVCYKCDPVYKP